jgi:hypothetical protein
MGNLNAVLNTNTSALMETRHLLVSPKYKELWGKSYTIELGCLAQGIPGIGNCTNTIVFIRHDDVPIDQRKDVMYGRMCVNYHPEKADPNRTCLTVGGICITYPGDCGTPTVDMVMVKIHLNSIISTKGTCYCTIDLKDFFLNTLMARPEYMRLKEFAQIYKLHDLTKANGFISFKIQKGMYGLPQAGILMKELLQNTQTSMVIAKAPSHQAYGDKFFARYPLHSALTTLASNASAVNTLSTSPAS